MKRGLKFAEKIPFDSLTKNALYRHLILVPKGMTQISKTILGPFTHTRNFLTQGQFALLNGNLFKDPRKITENFKEFSNIIN